MPTMSAKRDHPRMYGEHYKHRGSITPNPGSSPHVRGALFWCSGVCPDSGIIPACAGSTVDHFVVGLERGDHPRMCGEHLPRIFTPPLRPGSSPHVRGARMAMSARPRCAGIIPACAGSTRPAAPNQSIPRDHPRTCGEHHRNQSSPPSWAGSSPHVRGAPSLHHRRMRSHGIIPACAGSTASTSHTCVSAGDHPRMCGEHSMAVWTAASASGSSPHVRGAHCFPASSGVLQRIIPACAGSTMWFNRKHNEYGDHPRMCGEHLSCA